MKEIKLTIDGKEVRLTEEQLKALGTKVRKNPFERAKYHDLYYYVHEDNDVWSDTDLCADADNRRYDVANYFNEEVFAHQVALHQLLYRKLLKFAYDNEFEDEEWNGTNMHAYIIYNFTRKDYDIRWTRNEKEPGTVYFKTPTRATAALNEVVMPFVKEHPEFVW